MLSLRNRHFFLIDLALLPAAAVLAFALRLNTADLQRYGPHILLFVALVVPVKLLTFRLMGLYRRYWRYASADELVFVSVAVGVSLAITAALLLGLALPLMRITGFPRSIPLIDGLLTLLAVGGPRFAVRLVEQKRQRDRRQGQCEIEKRVLIVGAGSAGEMIVKEMQSNPQLGLVPVGFVDDDPRKHGVHIHSVPVLGDREHIPELVRSHEGGVDEVIIAMPTVPGDVIRDVLDACEQAGVPARTIPGLYDIISGQVSVSQIRRVDIADLLRREPVQIDAAAVQSFVRGRRVLVTGGGGSIGSELCRQIARAGPAQLVMLGHGEHSIFQIHAELKKWATCELAPVIADVRDRRRLEQVFAAYKPEIVFHAAAHKHVPLMELNLCDAVSNNVLGARNLVQVAEGNGVDCLILISTDKAVNPCSVMGVTKRVAELIVYQAAQRNRGQACFAVVRFGNVLGSRGSVVNVFKRQIARGGPVTVTHPDMRRYFMTIPEAVQLVRQAAALGHGGEVFVLDMGEPVRIVDLATDLVRLSGLRPRVEGWSEESAPDSENGKPEIEVIFTGIRPGDKMFEELFLEQEDYVRTCHEKIFVALNGRQALDSASGLGKQVDRLIELAQVGDKAEVRRLLGEIVPEYGPALPGFARLLPGE
ncbi:MAG: nucleoside-diphosphate sugar epimerase/dehydratase [Chloroflexota bacterium]|nr:nucleoside-diphosphate sugar epimerase/dehydratase [Chloroflexota bacterium]